MTPTLWRLVLAVALVHGAVGHASAANSLEAGRRALAQGDLREAQRRFRAAVAETPADPAGHLGRGEASEALGDFGEALEAYQAAARLAPGPRTQHYVGALAARMGRLDVAVAALTDSAGSSFPRRVRQSINTGGTAWADCFEPTRALVTCTGVAVSTSVIDFQSHPDAAQDLFRILVEAGTREGALGIARSQGWVREGVDYCDAHKAGLPRETAGLLAMLLQPDRADCAVDVGKELTEAGLTRLARRVLLDRIQHSGSADVRTATAAFLRHRLPAHDVAKLAESLNVVGYNLQNHYRLNGEAEGVYRRAIAADPRFSWPYQNIGRLYLLQNANEKAIGWLRQAVAANPDHFRAQFNLGVAAERLQRWDEAAGAFRRAVELNVDDADGHARLGWVLLKLDQETEAVRELYTAVRLNPALAEERRFLDRKLGADARLRPIGR
ncbi:MAG TPA: tetratricopeptide repeat protein [Methylomirabilota bacterium]|jgi:tetratricopeptide (TPR) repeat protein